MIFSIAMGADNSVYVKAIATYAPTFFGYIISVLAIVTTLFKNENEWKNPSRFQIHFQGLLNSALFDAEVIKR